MRSVAVSQTPGSSPGYIWAYSGRSRTNRILLLIWCRLFPFLEFGASRVRGAPGRPNYLHR